MVVVADAGGEPPGEAGFELSGPQGFKRKDTFRVTWRKARRECISNKR